MNCGSNVILAFTYYLHREKLKVVGKEDILETINKKAIDLAFEVSREPGNENCVVAGNICNTNVYVHEDPKTHN